VSNFVLRAQFAARTPSSTTHIDLTATASRRGVWQQVEGEIWIRGEVTECLIQGWWRGIQNSGVQIANVRATLHEQVAYVRNEDNLEADSDIDDIVRVDFEGGQAPIHLSDRRRVTSANFITAGDIISTQRSMFLNQNTQNFIFSMNNGQRRLWVSSATLVNRDGASFRLGYNFDTDADPRFYTRSWIRNDGINENNNNNNHISLDKFFRFGWDGADRRMQSVWRAERTRPSTVTWQRESISFFGMLPRWSSDEYGVRSDFIHDEFGNILTMTTGRDGITIRKAFAYNGDTVNANRSVSRGIASAREHLIGETNDLGHWIRYSIAPHTNIISISDARGIERKRLTLNACQDRIESIVADGVTSNMTYNDRGLVSKIQKNSWGNPSYTFNYNNLNFMISVNPNDDLFVRRNLTVNSLEDNIDSSIWSQYGTSTQSNLDYFDNYLRNSATQVNTQHQPTTLPTRIAYRDFNTRDSSLTFNSTTNFGCTPANASASAKIRRIEDRQGGQTHTITYDRAYKGMLSYLFRHNQSQDDDLEIMADTHQLDDNQESTVRFVNRNGMGSRLQTTTTYDNNVLLNPRITRVENRSEVMFRGTPSTNHFNSRITYEYDLLGRISAKEVQGIGNNLERIRYDYVYANYRETTDTNSQELTSTRMRTINIGMNSPNSPLAQVPVQNFTYVYDNNGNVIEVCGCRAGSHNALFNGSCGNDSQRIAYDNFERVVQSVGWENEDHFSYANGGINLGGNIDSKSTRRGRGTFRMYNYTYTPHQPNRIQRIDWGSQVYTFAYDRAGNPTIYKTRGFSVNMTWTRGRLLESYTPEGRSRVSYTYNTFGQVISRGASDGTTRYHYEGDKLLTERAGAGNAARAFNYEYDEAGVSSIVSQLANGTWERFTLIKNMFGDVVAICQLGRIVARYRYSATGEVTVVNNAGTPITDVNDIGHINPWRWRGYYYDTASEMYIIGGRFYDPELGRWVNPHDFEEMLSNPTESPYAFAGNNFAMVEGNVNNFSCYFPLDTEITAQPRRSWLQHRLAPVHNWWSGLSRGQRIVIGAVAIVGSIALAVLTGGASLKLKKAGLLVGKKGAILGASAKMTKKAAFASSAGGVIGFGIGGLSLQGGLSWDLDDAIEGFALGAAGGAITGGLGAPFKFAGNFVIGMGVNAGQQALQSGDINPMQMLVAGGLAGLGSKIPSGKTKRGILLEIAANDGVMLTEELIRLFVGW